MSFNVQKNGDKDIYVPWTDGEKRRLLRITDSTEKQIWVHKFHLNLTAGDGGTVQGGGRFKYMKSTTIKAIPNDKYEFVQWSDGNTNANRTVQMNQKNDINLHATFKLSGHYVNYYYYDNDTKVRYTQFVEHGQPATDPGLTFYDYKFIKWKQNGSGPQFGQPIYEDTEYHGRWGRELLMDDAIIPSSSFGSWKQESEFTEKIFPKNGKLNISASCTGRHGSSVVGHRVKLSVTLYGGEKISHHEIISYMFTSFDHYNANDPIGMDLLDESQLIKDDYNKYIIKFQKDVSCSVSWTFRGRIHIILD